jgi:hypothetical protein
MCVKSERPNAGHRTLATCVHQGDYAVLTTVDREIAILETMLKQVIGRWFA